MTFPHPPHPTPLYSLNNPNIYSYQHHSYRHYCIISNPIIKSGEGKPVFTTFGQVKIKHGDREVRHNQDYSDPFPLYPGEQLVGKVDKYLIVQQNQALRLCAERDFEDSLKIKRSSGDEWLLIGPLTYQPRTEEKVVNVISAQVIKPNQALRLRAQKNCQDSHKNHRKTGDEWLVREQGSYLPQLDEEVVGFVDGKVITDKKALKLRALRNFTDAYDIDR